MKNVTFIVLFSFIVSCTKNSHQVELILPLKKVSTIDSITTLYLINKSSKKIYISLDAKRYEPANEMSSTLVVGSINQIITSNEKDEAILNIMNSHPPKLNKEQKIKRALYYKKRKDSVLNKEKVFWLQGINRNLKINKKIIYPNDTLKIRIIIWLKGKKEIYYNFDEENISNEPIYLSYSFKTKNTYSLQYGIKQSKKEIESLLTQKEKDSLKKENIEIFDGVLYSNKIPLQIK